ncbi:MAG: hypothetical protein AVDCRST_MAG60-1079, partial [uncultured Nocardioides sp.]
GGRTRAAGRRASARGGSVGRAECRPRLGGGCVPRHQRRRRARPGGRHHRLRALADRGAGPAGARPPHGDPRRARPARGRDLRHLRGVRRRRTARAVGGAADRSVLRGVRVASL